jgi:hypothetical protein
MSKIALSSNALGTGTFTITSPNSNTDRTLNLPDSNGTILTTATAGVPVNGPAFSAYKSGSNQSLTPNVYTKVVFESEEFDTNSCFDSTTNYRFTPTVAGYYQISTRVEINGSGSSRNLAAIYKNGSIFKVGVDIGGLSPTTLGATVSALIYLNGSTDYVEVYCYVAFGSTMSAYSGIQTTYFQGAMVRAA